MLSYNTNENYSDFEANKEKLNFFTSDSEIIKGSSINSPKVEYDNEEFIKNIDKRIKSYNYLPIGSIMMYWNKDKIPAGWHLCDGTPIDSLDINNNESSTLKNILGSGTLPKMFYSKNETGVGADDVLAAIAREDEKYLSNHNIDMKFDKDGKYLGSNNYGGIKLETKNIPPHSHLINDYYHVENENHLSSDSDAKNYKNYYITRTQDKDSYFNGSFGRKIGAYYNGQDKNNNNPKYGCLVGPERSDFNNTCLLWVRNRTTGLIKQKLNKDTDYLTNDGYYWHYQSGTSNKYIDEDGDQKVASEEIWQNDVQKPIYIGGKTPAIQTYFIIKIKN